MRADRIVNPDMPVDEIMRRWPATIAVVLRHGMLCVGCPIGSFHTVTDACTEHGVDEAMFLQELIAAIRGEPIYAGGSPQSA
jgi:hybrid cluster-associated redox disulfide protein